MSAEQTGTVYTARADAYARMTSLTWACVDLRFTRGLASEAYQAKKKEMDKAKKLWLAAFAAVEAWEAEEERTCQGRVAERTRKGGAS